MEVINLVIDLPPVTKKNSQRILVSHTTGKPFVSPSKQYKDYETACLWMLKRQYKPVEPLASQLNIKVHFYIPTARKCDLTNLLEAVDDILVKAGVIADDNYTIVAGHDGSRVFVDRKKPRTEIKIERMDENGKIY